MARKLQRSRPRGRFSVRLEVYKVLRRLSEPQEPATTAKTYNHVAWPLIMALASGGWRMADSSVEGRSRAWANDVPVLGVGYLVTSNFR